MTVCLWRSRAAMPGCPGQAVHVDYGTDAVASRAAARVGQDVTGASPVPPAPRPPDSEGNDKGPPSRVSPGQRPCADGWS